MLRPNPLQPPRPFPLPAGTAAAARADRGFVSAEDYDRTGILTGMDPCESRYWWLAELYGPAPTAGGLQATSRPLILPTAAA
jgi:hypothetical protein